MVENLENREQNECGRHHYDVFKHQKDYYSFEKKETKRTNLCRPNLNIEWKTHLFFLLTTKLQFHTAFFLFL